MNINLDSAKTSHTMRVPMTTMTTLMDNDDDDLMDIDDHDLMDLDKYYTSLNDGNVI